MGIQGLLPLLSTVTEDVHVSKYNGQRVAIDAYVWLHKGAYCCSMELAQGIPTDKYINYCMHRVHLLVHNGVTPVLVFDGANLPAKQMVEASRKASRDEYKARAMQFLREGKRSAANDCFSKAVDISPQVAHRLIERLRAHGVECIVAPYEADAQLAYLSRSGYVDAVISEDSDLLPYGCSTVLFKMDKFGNGKEVRLENLGSCVRPVSFTNFTLCMLRQTCILSGCDYLESVGGIGVRKAHGFIKRFKDAQRAIKHMRMTGMAVPVGYEEAFTQAELTFLHQRVWCPREGRLVHLTPLDGLDHGMASLEFLGPSIPDALARQIAEAKVDPTTLAPYKEERPAVSSRYTDLLPTAGHAPMRRSASMPATSPVPLPVQRNKISNYFVKSSPGASKPFQPPRRAGEPQSDGNEEEDEDDHLLLLNEDSQDGDGGAAAVSPYFARVQRSRLMTASTGSIPLSQEEESVLLPPSPQKERMAGKRSFAALQADRVQVRSRFFAKSPRSCVFQARAAAAPQQQSPKKAKLAEDEEENRSNPPASTVPMPRLLFPAKKAVTTATPAGTEPSTPPPPEPEQEESGPPPVECPAVAAPKPFLAPALQRFVHRRKSASSVFHR